MTKQSELNEQQWEMNHRYSASTAYSTWLDKYHFPNLDHDDKYRDCYMDCVLAVEADYSKQYRLDPDNVKNMVDRLFYIISSSPQPTLSIATVVSSLHASKTLTFTGDYETDIQLWTDIVCGLSNVGIFGVFVSPSGHPVVTCTLSLPSSLTTELGEKFQSVLPQIEGSMGHDACKPKGVRYTGKSTRRKIPLNKDDWRVLETVNSQMYHVDMDILNMKYYVPSITDTGKALTEDEKDMARVYFNRFKFIAEWADSEGRGVQCVTNQDSRGRFYNFLTDPHIRLSLRSKVAEGNLTDWEKAHLLG